MSVGTERLIPVGTALVAVVAAAFTHGVLQLLPEVSFAAHAWMMLGVLIAVGILGTGLWCETQPDGICLLYTSPSPRDLSTSRMPSSA